MCKAALPVTLRHDAIVQILLPVIQINRILRVTEQEISQAHHIVDRAVLLIFVSQSCLQLVRRAPDLTAGLTSGHIRSTVCDCTLPIRLRNIQITLLTCHFIGCRRTKNLRNCRVRMHICQYIFSCKQSVKKTLAVIAIHQCAEHLVLCNPVQNYPYFEHTTGLYVKDFLKLCFCIFSAPVIKPLSEIHRHIQCFFTACQLIHIQQTHKCLVNRVLRRPYRLLLSDPIQKLFRNRSRPLSAIVLLASRQLFYDLLCLCTYLLIAGRLIMHSSRRQPVTEKMPSQLTQRGFPATMNVLWCLTHFTASRFHQIWKQQMFTAQLQQIIFIFLPSSQKLLVAKVYLSPFYTLYHAHLLRTFLLIYYSFIPVIITPLTNASCANRNAISTGSTEITEEAINTGQSVEYIPFILASPSGSVYFLESLT